MNSDSDPLRRSMDAAPEAWLDELVADRVMTVVRQAGAARAEERAHEARRGPRLGWLRALRALVVPIRALLGRLLLPSAQPLLWRDGDQEG